MELQEMLEKFALENALRHKGKAVTGAIVGQLINAMPEAKDNMKEHSKSIAKAVAKINKLSNEQQRTLAEEKYPDLLEKKEKEERDIFEFLGIEPGQKVKTGFPPGPEKHPHIGHAKSLLLNYMLAKKYSGQFVLRFEDTNPSLVKPEYYKIMIDDFEWLGVELDELQYASDHMDLFYDYAKKVIDSEDAYICTCSTDVMRSNRELGEACQCRDQSKQDNALMWQKFANMETGSAVLRLKIDLKHDNSTMRDPVIFRLMDDEHARQQKRYRAWPNYDFQNAIMDGHFGITHRLRSKEFEMRSELQRYIQNLLGLSNTKTYEFARFNMEGVPSSGRVIREMIAKGELVGWDDPTLTTISALRRRGFTPQAIKNFVISTGITKSESTMTWNDLIVHNRRVLDEDADRFFFVKDPVKIRVEGTPRFKAIHHLHPTHRRGGREFDIDGEFFISKADFESLKEGELYRFMDCINFTKQGSKFVFHSKEYEQFKESGAKITHYLPSNAELVRAKVMMPDKSLAQGLCEPAVKNLSVGTIIQAERFGFMRLDLKEDELTFWYTHN